MKRIGFLSLLCVALVATACNRKDSADMTAAHDIGGGSTDMRNDRTDRARQFVMDRIAAGAHEIQLAHLAEQRGSSVEIKQFAAMMIRDHTAAGEQLNEIAARENIQRPTELEDSRHSDVIDRLSTLSGAEFDRAYIDMMVKDHGATLNVLQARADEHRVTGTSGSTDADPGRGAAGSAGEATTAPGASAEAANSSFEMQVNQWAANTLPTVRMHLERAKAISDGLGSGIGDKLKTVK